jgi:predicted permease
MPEWLRFWKRSQIDAEVRLELHEFVECETEHNIASGMTPRDARQAALRRMGNTTRIREWFYERYSIPLIEPMWRDVRFAARQLRRAPGFAATAIASLALAIGATTAMFWLLDALSLRQLPVVIAPEALFEVKLVGDGRAGRLTGRNRQLSYPQWRELAGQLTAFRQMLAFGDTRFNVAPRGEVRYVEGLWVSGSYFATLGVKPAIGRLLDDRDDRPGCGYRTAVISYDFWEREFRRSADVLSQTLSIGPERVPIVGVTEKGFFGLEVGRQFAIALPLCTAASERPDHWWLAAVGRLRQDVTLDQARAELDTIMPGVQRRAMPPTYSADMAASYVAMRAVLHEARTGLSPLRQAYERPLSALLAIAGVMLLLASINLANLLLARATAREQEFKIRLAIGGSKARVLQQVLLESLVLAAVSAVIALFVAWLLAGSLLPLISTSVDRIFLDLSIDWRVFGFAAAASLATAVIFGVAPALWAIRRPTPATVRAMDATRLKLSLRRGLVMIQLGLTLTLVFASTLFARSLWKLTGDGLGFRSEQLLVANVFFREDDAPIERRRAIYRDLLTRLQALPDVANVAEAFNPPLGGSFWDTQTTIDGVLSGITNVNQVSDGYFATLGTPLIAGRDFNARDIPGSQPVAIVNESLARRFGSSPLGRSITTTAPGWPDATFEIVGIVADQKYQFLREDSAPILYRASSQQSSLPLTQRYVIRATTTAWRLRPPVSSVLNAVAPTSSVRFAAMDDQVLGAALQERLLARLSVWFSGIALLLAVLGTYGVVSFGVAARRREIGVRIALGATKSSVMSMVFRDAATVLTLGIVTGAVAALAGGKLLGALLYRVDATDLTSLAIAMLLLATMGLAATWIPSARAARLDPAAILRD